MIPHPLVPPCSGLFGNLLVTLVGVVLGLAACGGDEDRADTTRPRQPPTTTDGPTLGTGETTVPGAGGFIETPRTQVDEAAWRDAALV